MKRGSWRREQEARENVHYSTAQTTPVSEIHSLIFPKNSHRKMIGL